VLVHGAAARPNLFYGAPLQTTIADALLQRGYDVWVEGWRASIDDPPRRWTLDRPPRLTIPPAIATVVRETGRERRARARALPRLRRLSRSRSSPGSCHRSRRWSRARSDCTLSSAAGAVETAALMPGLRLTTPYLDAQWASARRPPTRRESR